MTVDYYANNKHIMSMNSDESGIRKENIMKDFEGVKFTELLDELKGAFINETFGFSDFDEKRFGTLRYDNTVEFNATLEELRARYNEASRYACECRNEMIRARRELGELKNKLCEITGCPDCDDEDK